MGTSTVQVVVWGEEYAIILSFFIYFFNDAGLVGVIKRSI